MCLIFLFGAVYTNEVNDFVLVKVFGIVSHTTFRLLLY